MDLGLFKQKLRALNPRLYVDEKHQVTQLNKIGTSGIYLKDQRSEKIDSEWLDGDSRRIAEAYNSTPDLYVGWTTHQYIPEGDKFDDNGKLIARGWRTTLKMLWQAGHIDIKKAGKVFNWYLSDYDRMNYNQRIKFERAYGATDSDSRIHS